MLPSVICEDEARKLFGETLYHIIAFEFAA
ncbi:hypothetical protein X732_31320 [Mesorhizobium sp. L2C066B000]|nr:hypothetical protein X732_31320 [Mesorhizobium sp. L2C066B000]